MKPNFKIFLLLIISLQSCNGYKKKLIINGNQGNAIENMIMDFSNTEKGRINKVYNISIENESTSLYHFNIDSVDNVYTYKRVSIGNKVSGFPSKFIEVKKRLYIWEDSTQIVSQEIIKKLHKYKVLDSTIYKIEIGELSEEKAPSYKTNELRKSLNYFFCKNNITQYIKVKTNMYITETNYPQIDCK